MTTTPAHARPDPAHEAWPRIVPFAVFIIIMAVQPYLEPWVEPVLDPRWLYAVRSLVTAVLLAILWRYYIELRPAAHDAAGSGRVDARGVLLAVAVGLVVFVLWIYLDFPPLVLGTNDEPYTPLVDGRIDWALALTRLAGSALVVPVMEELFWRSFLMRWIEKSRFTAVDPATVGMRALLISSAIFAVEHHLWFAGLLAGLAYGELYRRTRSVWIVIIAHAVTNAVLGAYVLATGAWQFW